MCSFVRTRRSNSAKRGIAHVLAAVAVGASLSLSHSASAAFPDLTPIYVIPGVEDDGGSANTGIATVVSCTKVGNYNETVSLAVHVLSADGVTRAYQLFDLTYANFIERIATHGVVGPGFHSALNSGAVNGGTIVVFATYAGVFCGAKVQDASKADPSGFSLHVVRFNPTPGTQE